MKIICLQKKGEHNICKHKYIFVTWNICLHSLRKQTTLGQFSVLCWFCESHRDLFKVFRAWLCGLVRICITGVRPTERNVFWAFLKAFPRVCFSLLLKYLCFQRPQGDSKRENRLSGKFQALDNKIGSKISSSYWSFAEGTFMVDGVPPHSQGIWFGGCEVSSSAESSGYHLCGGGQEQHRCPTQGLSTVAPSPFLLGVQTGCLIPRPKQSRSHTVAFHALLGCGFPRGG